MTSKDAPLSKESWSPGTPGLQAQSDAFSGHGLGFRNDRAKVSQATGAPED